jgi:hypothetical protein
MHAHDCSFGSSTYPVPATPVVRFLFMAPQEQQELQLAKQQLEADCRSNKQQLSEAQAAAVASRAAADAAHDNLRSVMLQLKLAAQSLADVHKEQEQKDQQGSEAQEWQQPPQWQVSRVQQLFIQIVHELAVLPRLEEQAVAELGSSVPVMLRLPRLMARVVLTQQQLHSEQQVRMLAGCGLGWRLLLLAVWRSLAWCFMCGHCPVCCAVLGWAGLGLM